MMFLSFSPVCWICRLLCGSARHAGYVRSLLRNTATTIQSEKTRESSIFHWKQDPQKTNVRAWLTVNNHTHYKVPVRPVHGCVDERRLLLMVPRFFPAVGT